MTATPTGRLLGLDGGRYDLVLTRTFRAATEDVWASITEPERTARWFGTWEGEPGAGRTVRVQSGFEEGAPWNDVVIDACEPPRHLAVSLLDEHGQWRLEVHLTEVAGVTTLTLTHHLDNATGVGDVGPGWEYYLDMLVASRDGGPLPDFGDYHPAQTAYFTEQLAH